MRDPENWELEFTETGAIMRPAHKTAAPVQSELERRVAEARRELTLIQELQKQRKEL